METLVDLVARSRRSDATALRAPADDQFYDYQRLCTTTWKTANFLHARGVRERSTVAVADDACAEPVLAILAASLLGARSYVGAPSTVDARVLVAHVDDVDAYDLEPGTQRIGYGGDPSDPDVYHFEGDVWSENPTIPPEAADRSGTNVALVSGYEARTHGELLEAAADIVDEASLTAETTVAIRAPLADPRTVTAGVVAPLSVGGTILFPGSTQGDADGDGDSGTDGEEADTDGPGDAGTIADVAVIGPNATAPEPRTISVRDVEF